MKDIKIGIKRITCSLPVEEKKRLHKTKAASLAAASLNNPVERTLCPAQKKVKRLHRRARPKGAMSGPIHNKEVNSVSKWPGKKALIFGVITGVAATVAAVVFAQYKSNQFDKVSNQFDKVSNQFDKVSNQFAFAAKALDDNDCRIAESKYIYLSGLGYSEADYRLGLIYENGCGNIMPDAKMAADRFELAAAQNHVDAQHKLACKYEKGVEVPFCYEKAAKLYLSAADQNHTDSQYRLALLYEEGQGVEQSVEKASSLLQSAANQNHPSALFLLGQHYAYGRGVEKDPSKAAALIEKSLLMDTDEVVENYLLPPLLNKK